MVKLNAQGEVADFQDVSQFEPNESEFECGEFAAATVKFAGYPGRGATGTQEDIDQTADAFYAKYIGPNTQSDILGTTIEVMHKIIKDCGFDYQDVSAITPTSQQASDIAHIKAALAQGYPLIATITETSVIDLDLGRNPYSWGPSGTHTVIYSGIASNGNLLVRDSANIIGPLQVNNTVRPGPRRYDINQIATQWATMIRLAWLPPFAGNQFVEQSAKDCWNSTAHLFNGTPPRYESGIARAWQQLYALGKKPGPPLTQEYHSVDWGGKAIIVQEFAYRRAEYSDGQTHWY